jgi:uncharacterized protein YdhG (YjbR/CyaY superfamily)
VITPDLRVTDYIADARPDRRAALEMLRALCRTELDGFVEELRYGMPGYVRTPGGDVEIGFASQKRYLSLYVTRTDVMDAFRDVLVGLDVGKGCIRYRRPEQLDADVIRQVLRRTAATTGPVC